MQFLSTFHRAIVGILLGPHALWRCSQQMSKETMDGVMCIQLSRDYVGGNENMQQIITLGIINNGL